MKPLAAVLLYVLAFGIHVFGMIFGWGIQPENWGWIVACYVAALITIASASAVMKP